MLTAQLQQTPVRDTGEVCLYLCHCDYLIKLCLETQDLDELLTVIDEIQENLSLVRDTLLASA